MSHRFHGVYASVLLATALLAQAPDAPTFNANAKLVLVPFNVQRGKYFAADLRPSDFILREDGHPREFTIFEGPHTEHPLPLELILLFDTTPEPPGEHPLHWFPRDPKADYEFLDNWDEAITREVLQKNGMDIRIAVYHYALHQLERLCAASSDPREIVHAFHALLDPIPPGKGELTMLPGNHVTKPLFGPPNSGWLSESVVGTLKDAAASPVAARRLLIVFTAGGSGTFSFSKSLDPYPEIVSPALAMNIPIHPVIMDVYKQNVIVGGGVGAGGALATVDLPKLSGDSLSRAAGMSSTWYKGLLPGFVKVGELTGGEAFVPQRLDREAMAGILGLVRNTTLSQYIVGFGPDASSKPRKHSLAVALKSKSKGHLVGGEKTGVVY